MNSQNGGNEVAPILSHSISPTSPNEVEEASIPNIGKNTRRDTEVGPVPSHIISMQSLSTPTEDDEGSNPSRDNEVAPVPSHIISMQSPPTPTEVDEASIPNTSKNTSRDNEVAPVPSHIISMQSPPNPTEGDEASIPTEIVREAPILNCTVAVRRKAAKRTHPWDLIAGELQLVSPLPKAEDESARKKPRLEEPLPTTTDEAAGKTTSTDVSLGARKKPRLEEPLPTTDEAAGKTTSPAVSLGLPPPPPAADVDDANANPVTNTQPNAGGTGRWTTDEDAKLTHAFVNTYKKKHGNEYTPDWVAISALVPSRTKNQCSSKWYNALDRHIITGKWTLDEDNKLKDAVQMHDGKDWDAIAHLVSVRTRIQCFNRWHDILDSGIDRANKRTGRWAEDEDIKLKDAVQMHGGKNWGAIATLVPGRTKFSCCKRWTKHLDPNRSTVEWKVSVKTDGMISWIPTSTGR
jgi:hypothetical protein